MYVPGENTFAWKVKNLDSRCNSWSSGPHTAYQSPSIPRDFSSCCAGWELCHRKIEDICWNEYQAIFNRQKWSTIRPNCRRRQIQVSLNISRSTGDWGVLSFPDPLGSIEEYELQQLNLNLKGRNVNHGTFFHRSNWSWRSLSANSWTGRATDKLDFLYSFYGLSYLSRCPFSIFPSLTISLEGDSTKM